MRHVFAIVSACLLYIWSGVPAFAQAPVESALSQVFRDCDVCPEMVIVPPGSFVMGSPRTERGRYRDEGPRRTITIARAFAVGRYEITRGQFAAFSLATGREPSDACSGTLSWENPGFAQADDHPVVCVTWDDAQAYIRWLNAQTSGGYRLLSESEWEYAARAGTDTIYPWGNFASHEYANYGIDQGAGGLASGRDEWVNTSPSGRFPPNEFGLSDMVGNVWEWTEDCYINTLAGVPSDGVPFTLAGMSAGLASDNRTRSVSCSQRVARGGAFHMGPRGLRTAFRNGANQSNRGNAALGFRVAKTLDPDPAR